MAEPESQRRVHQWLQWELSERAHRSLERRLRDAHLGQFKPMADFDWSWPQEFDRAAVEELMGLQFLGDATNVVLVGPNGVGKSMCAPNLGYQAVLAGHTVLFTTAGQMLSELAALDSDAALRRRLQRYAAPELLLIDEVGYLSYSDRHADLLFELVSRRYLTKSTVVTTNKQFADWNQVFPNAACVVSLVDRLMHRVEVVRIKDESYRQKEAKERAAQRAAARSSATRIRSIANGPRMNNLPGFQTQQHLELPTHWTPEQALAVFELVDLLRDQLWAAYGIEIQRALHADRITVQRSLPLDPDEPF